MNAAICCAFSRDRAEADECWACVVYAPDTRWLEHSPVQRAGWTSHARLDELGGSMDLAFEIGGPAGPAHILLKKILRGARLADRHVLARDILRQCR